jgi:hypothetical protein
LELPLLFSSTAQLPCGFQFVYAACIIIIIIIIIITITTTIIIIIIIITTTTTTTFIWLFIRGVVFIFTCLCTPHYLL